MRIGVDARTLISETSSSIAVYLLEVLKNLEDNGNTYISISEIPLYGGLVVAAQNSSHPEADGEHNMKDIAKKMVQCSKISVEQCCDVEAKGKKCAEQFGWKKCSKQTQEILEMRQVCREDNKCL